MGLFEPIWKTRLFHTDKEKKAVEYVRRLTSPEKLLEISLSAPSLDVRKAAVEGFGRYSSSVTTVIYKGKRY